MDDPSGYTEDNQFYYQVESYTVNGPWRILWIYKRTDELGAKLKKNSQRAYTELIVNSRYESLMKNWMSAVSHKSLPAHVL